MAVRQLQLEGRYSLAHLIRVEVLYDFERRSRGPRHVRFSACLSVAGGETRHKAFSQDRIQSPPANY